MSIETKGATPGQVLTRRNFIQVAAALGLAAPVAGAIADKIGFPMTASAAEKVALSMAVFAGGRNPVIPKRVVAEYIAAHPEASIEVIESSNAALYPQMRAAQQANPDKPLVNIGYYNTASSFQGDADDMWESLDPARIPNMNNILPNLRRPDNKGAAPVLSPIGIVYNKDKMATPPKSWVELFTDPALRGRIVGTDYGWAFNGLLQAVMVHGGDVRKPEAGFKFIADNAKQYLTLAAGGSQIINLFGSGEAWICIQSRSFQNNLINSGINAGFVIPDEGAILQPIFLQIVKGTSPEQRAVAEAIINILLSPEIVSEYVAGEAYTPAISGVSIPAELADDPALKPDVADKALKVDWAAMAEVDSDYREMWDQQVKTQL